MKAQSILSSGILVAGIRVFTALLISEADQHPQLTTYFAFLIT